MSVIPYFEVIVENLKEKDEEKSASSFSVSFYLLLFLLLTKQHHNCSESVPLKTSELCFKGGCQTAKSLTCILTAGWVISGDEQIV